MQGSEDVVISFCRTMRLKEERKKKSMNHRNARQKYKENDRMLFCLCLFFFFHSIGIFFSAHFSHSASQKKCLQPNEGKRKNWQLQ